MQKGQLKGNLKSKVEGNCKRTFKRKLIRGTNLRPLYLWEPRVGWGGEPSGATHRALPLEIR